MSSFFFPAWPTSPYCIPIAYDHISTRDRDVLRVSSDERDRLSGLSWVPGSDGMNGIIDVTFYRLSTTTLGIGEENASASGAIIWRSHSGRMVSTGY
jgi:hypothetical protein